jgi:TPR repeat protein
MFNKSLDLKPAPAVMQRSSAGSGDNFWQYPPRSATPSNQPPAGKKSSAKTIVIAGLALAAAIGVAHMQKHPVTPLMTLTQLAQDGDEGAQLQLGLTYREGRNGVAPDQTKAIYWLERAADGGQSYAQDLVGQMYATGDGVPSDATQAVSWWQKAAAKGSADAQRRLGEAYATGKGTPVDHSAAEHWLGKAADEGDQKAESLLARMYRDGHATSSDLHRGKSWLERAGLEGRSGVLRAAAGIQTWLKAASPVKSIGVLKEEAADGDVDAQYQLANRYQTGAWGVEQDQSKARYWLKRAADNGNPLALRSLARANDKANLEASPDSKRVAFRSAHAAGDSGIAQQ